MNILVTGAAGAIGSHVAEALIREGHSVRGLDSFAPYYSRSLKELNKNDIVKTGVQFFEVNLAKDDLSQYVEGAEVIFHFAAQPGISAATPFEAYVENNILATHRLLQAAQKENISLFVYISTSSVYGKRAVGDETVPPEPASYYGATKLAGEQLALSYWRDKGFPVTVLRLFSVYGERERPEKLYHKLIDAILHDKEFPLYEGAQNHVRSYTYVGDIIKGCLLTLEKKDSAVGEIFNLGTDKTITTGEGIAIIERILGKKAKIKYIPKRQGDQLETQARIDKARVVLGYKPKVTPEEGLRYEILWYKNNLAA